MRLTLTSQGGYAAPYGAPQAYPPQYPPQAGYPQVR